MPPIKQRTGMIKVFVSIFISVLLLMPGISFPHVYMLESDPTENAVMQKAPEKIKVVFLGSVEPIFSKIEVFDTDGKKVSKKTRLLEDDTIMEADLDETLPEGEYTVKWLCMGLDGHKQKGEFTFAIQKQ